MKYTLLELTQDVLSSMDSDEITSITDTVEAQQVVKVIRTTYYDIVNRAGLPEQETLFKLDETDANTPPVMTLPDDYRSAKWIKYNIADAGADAQYTDITPIDNESFMFLMYELSSSSTDVSSYTFIPNSDSMTFFYYNDRAPTMYTTFGDHYVVFNGVDETQESFLDTDKSVAYGKKLLVWNDSDGFTPELDEPQFELLLNESKALAWQELKQTPHLKAETTARREWVNMQKTKYALPKTSDFDELPYFGRK